MIPHENAEGTEAGLEMHGAVAASINRIIAGGNSVRRPWDDARRRLTFTPDNPPVLAAHPIHWKAGRRDEHLCSGDRPIHR